MNDKQKSALRIGSVCLLIVLAITVRYFPAIINDRSHRLWLICTFARSLLYISLFAAWGISVSRRIIQKQVRLYMIAISMLMLLWMAFRTLKFIFFTPSDIGRYLWYMYYLPQLFIPVLMFLTALSLGKPEGFHHPKWIRLLFIPPAVLLLAVLTNDLHRLAFAFPRGLGHFESGEYTYQIVYFISMIWSAVFVAASFAVLVVKCRIPATKKRIWLPCIPMIAMVVYTVLYLTALDLLKPLAADMTVVSCLLCAAMLEACIKCRLIQSNMHYEKLFRISNIAALITDENLNVVYRSDGVKNVDGDLLRCACKQETMIDENTRLLEHPISNGHSFWKEDISELQANMRKLQASQTALQKYKDLIDKENVQEKRRLKLKEQQALYDMVQEKNKPQLDLLSTLVQDIETAADEAQIKRLLGKSVVIGANIKRRTNLQFLNSENKKVHSDELELCFKESSVNLALYGVHSSFKIDVNEQMPLSVVEQLYDFYTQLVEAALDSLSYCHAVVRRQDSDYILCIMMECDDVFEKFDNADIQKDDDLWYCTLTVSAGGDAV